ncbi:MULTISPECIES: glycine cleavage system aminomethyltransferase GcvT [unclassified Tolypothrix]|uniref:glycine cleavage system aminomethyltransferase GcvT n=1 Tax=unclassified Tolypothrix TaxID=2649714 RepID=UPI0005EAB700|nr:MULTISPECIES: glycine cleavage system aminomethyltransferase GcvT [unclassified Tolypothrix]BAY94645.1 glycine cleavage system T protein [Microchaete diplosiphon NIES-3275]EKE99137.1 glycine cleavage system T protein [Tolypothrix sp. PCC 7601]MBE9088083.1 glycine cleavage system aminomethyltransferase GcvT [Tolypothrix sp. LEGE 11397]UYD28341.1 glycine cleavage system aminomethyltransferase GcvT [Tolypothrix sp. PCC 7712]UYD35784.1 glycine cleavage system aminomethyltransferase GcvT [Tolypo
MANQKIEIVPSLLRTPLYQLGLKLKARFTNFSGWEMPVQYSGITREHEAVRNEAGMFDISHMGKFTLQGKNPIEQLQKLVPSELNRLKPGQAQYTVLLNPQGGIIDDIIIYYQGEDSTGKQQVAIIVNAGTTDKDKAWLLQHLDLNAVEFQDLSQDKALIAVQGPKAVQYLQSFVEADLNPIKAFGHLQAPVLGKTAFLARTGYTGEDGFEVMVDPEVGIELWQSLADAGVIPCGLGARDTLRLEAAMALYGQDIDDTTTPLEAGLGWLVHLDTKGDFIGRTVLEEQKANKLKRRLVGLQMQGRNIARHGYQVLSSGKVVGEVTSGTLSPTLGYPIALAYVPSQVATIGQQLEVEIRGKAYPADVVKRPFYRSKNRA